MSNKGIILVVDDIPANLQLLVKMLEPQGYQVHPANSGEIALATVAEIAPELILLDICMPKMDGFEVFRQLKARPECCDIPVIFITVSTEVDQRLQGLKLGAVDYISKPFHVEELLVRIGTHVKLRRLQAQLKKIHRLIAED